MSSVRNVLTWNLGQVQRRRAVASRASLAKFPMTNLHYGAGLAQDEERKRSHAWCDRLSV